MTLLSIGETVSILAGVVYALPTIPVEFSSGAQIQSALLEAGPFTNVSPGLINGAFVKSATTTTIKLKKVIYG